MGTEFNPLLETLAVSERLRIQNGKLYREDVSVRQNGNFFWRLVTRKQYSQQRVLEKINGIGKEVISTQNLVAAHNLSSALGTLVGRAHAQNEETKTWNPIIRWLCAKQFIDLSPFKETFANLQKLSGGHFSQLNAQFDHLNVMAAIDGANFNSILTQATNLEDRIHAFSMAMQRIENKDFTDQITDLYTSISALKLKCQSAQLKKDSRALETNIAQAEEELRSLTEVSIQNFAQAKALFHRLTQYEKEAEQHARQGNTYTDLIPSLESNVLKIDTLKTYVAAKQNQIFNNLVEKVDQLSQEDLDQCAAKIAKYKELAQLVNRSQVDNTELSIKIDAVLLVASDFAKGQLIPIEQFFLSIQGIENDYIAVLNQEMAIREKSSQLNEIIKNCRQCGPVLESLANQLMGLCNKTASTLARAQTIRTGKENLEVWIKSAKDILLFPMTVGTLDIFNPRLSQVTKLIDATQAGDIKGFLSDNFKRNLEKEQNDVAATVKDLLVEKQRLMDAIDSMLVAQFREILATRLPDDLNLGTQLGALERIINKVHGKEMKRSLTDELAPLQQKLRFYDNLSNFERGLRSFKMELMGLSYVAHTSTYSSRFATMLSTYSSLKSEGQRLNCLNADLQHLLDETRRELDVMIERSVYIKFQQDLETLQREIENAREEQLVALLSRYTALQTNYTQFAPRLYRPTTTLSFAHFPNLFDTRRAQLRSVAVPVFTPTRVAHSQAPIARPNPVRQGLPGTQPAAQPPQGRPARQGLPPGRPDNSGWQGQAPGTVPRRGRP